MTTAARVANPVGTKGVPRHERQEQILDAAAEEFGSRGYAFASLVDIAIKAGISKPLIYTYFGSKDGLYLAALRRAGEGLVKAVADAQHDTGPVRALHTLEAVFETLASRRHDWRVLYDETLPGESVVHLAARDYRRQLAHLGVAGTREVLAESGVTNELDSSLLSTIWLGAVSSVPPHHSDIGATVTFHDALLRQMHDPLVLAVPFFLVMIAIELTGLVVLDREDRRYDARDTATSIAMGLSAGVVAVFFRGSSLVGYVALYTFVAPWHLPADRWETWVGVMIAIDLLWYLYHRMSHRIRLMWAAHQAHHNSNYFNTSTAFRQKWNQWFESLAWVPLPLLGVPPWMVIAGFSVNLIYQFFVHTEAIGKLPRPVEFVFNTPSHHRVHHANDAIYLDRNFGGILIIWDRMFGTFQAEEHRPTYGLTTPIYSNNLVRLQFHEYAALISDVRAADGIRARFGYVFGPPGWKPSTSAAAITEAQEFVRA